MGFNPGDRQLMMVAHVLEELANVLNDGFVADRVVREETNAVLAVVRSQGQGPWCPLEATLEHDTSR